MVIVKALPNNQPHLDHAVVGISVGIKGGGGAPGGDSFLVLVLFSRVFLFVCAVIAIDSNMRKLLPKHRKVSGPKTICWGACTAEYNTYHRHYCFLQQMTKHVHTIPLKFFFKKNNAPGIWGGGFFFLTHSKPF